MLYRAIEAHLPTFLARTAGDAETPGLPAFVMQDPAVVRTLLAHDERARVTAAPGPAPAAIG